MYASELRNWVEVFADANTQTQIQCVLVVGGGSLANCVRKLHSTWAFDEVLAHNLALDAMRINAQVLRALVPFARLWSFDKIADKTEQRGTLIWNPTSSLPGDSVPETWAATSDSIGLYLAQHLPAKALFLVKSLQTDTLRDASAATLSREGTVDGYFPQLFARRPVTTRVVSKVQFSDFAEACQSGNACSVGTAVTEYRAKPN